MDKIAPGIKGLRPTQDLQREYMGLKNKLESLQRRFSVVHDLSRKYRSCKHHIPVRRYWELKHMIRVCVTAYNNVLLEDERKEKGGAREFRRTANQLAAATEDVSKLQKAEIVAGIEEMKKQKHKLEPNKSDLHNRLEELKRKYAESKRNLPPERYRRMKEMIKALINDKILNV